MHFMLTYVCPNFRYLVFYWSGPETDFTSINFVIKLSFPIKKAKSICHIMPVNKTVNAYTKLILKKHATRQKKNLQVLASGHLR